MSYINIGDFTGGEQDYWSWSHLKNFVGQDEAAEHFYAVLASLFAYGYQPMSHTAHNRGVYWGFALMIICFHFIQTYTYVIYRNVWRSIDRATAREREKRLAAKAGENAAADVQAVAQV
ncbi:MAG: hypothetical protein FRX49_13493 [Trebouxia sp. A1-2]|nr:MAG: hypothetical protein FRX49_13493 [Trebouxia sp. A1-2]